MKKGIFYATQTSLQKIFNLPEDAIISNVIHDPKTDDFEFVVYVPDEFADEHETQGEIRRIELTK